MFLEFLGGAILILGAVWVKQAENHWNEMREWKEEWREVHGLNELDDYEPILKEDE